MARTMNPPSPVEAESSEFNNDIMQWIKQRKRTIKAMDLLRKKLDVFIIAASCLKGAGSLVQIVGAVVAITGAVMALGKSTKAMAAMNIGNLINHSGGLIAELLNIFESHASRGYLREAKAELDADEKLSRALQEKWMNSSRNLNASLQMSFASDLNSSFDGNAPIVAYEFAMLLNPIKVIGETLDLRNRRQYSTPAGVEAKIEKLIGELDASPQGEDDVKVFRSELGELCKELKKAQNSANPPTGTDQTPTGSTDGGTTGVLSTAPHQARFPSPNLVLVFCGFTAKDLATSIMSLISVTINVKDGHSKFSDALGSIVRKLEFQLRSVGGRP